MFSPSKENFFEAKRSRRAFESRFYIALADMRHYQQKFIAPIRPLISDAEYIS